MLRPVWETVFVDLFTKGYLFLPPVAFAIAGDFFRWRFKTNRNRTTLWLTTSFYITALASFSAIFVLYFLIYRSFLMLFVYLAILAWGIHRLATA